VARNTAWEELAHATVSALKQFRFMKLKWYKFSLWTL
jgi:hypothetical protein